MKISPIQNTAFKAKLTGDYNYLKNFAQDNGLSKEKIKNVEDEIQKIFPSNEDTLEFKSRYSKKHNGPIIKVTLQNEKRNLTSANNSVEFAIPLKRQKDYKNLFLCLVDIVVSLSLKIP